MIFVSEKDYYITGVRYNTIDGKKHITELEIAIIEGNTIKKKFVISKTEAVKNLLSGKKNYYTAYVGLLGKIDEGEKVHLYRKNQHNYLRIEMNVKDTTKLEEDDLGKLPTF